jgi:threonine dehydratase
MNEAVRDTLLARVYDVAIISPLEHAHKLSQELGNEVYLKREDLQPVHSFKLRGAYNKIAQLNASEKKRGVIAASAGNHAQGVALSAQKLGIKATIVMPITTPDIKVSAVKSYGAEVVQFGDNFSEAYEHCLQLLRSTQQVFVHPFDDPAVIAGQGTIGKEIIEQQPNVTHIFVPIGGGGLIAGIAQYVKAVRPNVQIIGVEPEDSNAMQSALKKGAPTDLKHVGIFADGVAVKRAGDNTFAIAQQFVDEIITVDNDQICAAIKSIYEDSRTIVEPAGALSVAAAKVYAQSHALRGQIFATICSGANMSFEKLQFVAERTLLGSGKEALFAIDLPQTPGALEQLCREVVHDHNITEFCYRMQSREQARILVGFTMRSSTDKHRFMTNMRDHDYAFTDISDDDVAKQHIRHMVGGKSKSAQYERQYEIYFPERSRALNDFLEALQGKYNISLFHYRGQGGDVGRVYIGLEAENQAELESALTNSGYEFSSVDSPAAKLFL